MIRKPLILLGLSHAGKTTAGALLAALLNTPFYDTDDLIQLQTGLTPRELCKRDGVQALHRAEAAALGSCLTPCDNMPHDSTPHTAYPSIQGSGENNTAQPCLSPPMQIQLHSQAQPCLQTQVQRHSQTQNYAANSRAAVIAAGGGIADNAEAAALLTAIPYRIFLYAARSELFARLTRDARKTGHYPAFLQFLPAEQEAEAQRLFLPLYTRRTAYYRSCCTGMVDTTGLTAAAVAEKIAEAAVLHTFKDNN